MSKTYEIVKNLTLSTKNGMKKKGDKIKSEDIHEEKLKYFLKEGFLMSESEAKKKLEKAEAAETKASENMANVKKLQEEVSQAEKDLEQREEDLKAEKESFEEEKKTLKEEVKSLKEEVKKLKK